MTFAYESFPFAFYDKAKSMLKDFPVSTKCLIWVNYDLMSQQNKFTLLLKHPDELYQPYTQTFYNNNLIEWDTALPEALERFDALQKAIRHSSFEEFTMVEDESENDNGWESWGEDNANIGKTIEQYEAELDEYNQEDEEYEMEEKTLEDDQPDSEDEEQEEIVDEPTKEDLNSDEKESDEPTSEMDDKYDDLFAQMSNVNTDRQKIEKIWFSNMKNILYAKQALDSQMSCFME